MDEQPDHEHRDDEYGDDRVAEALGGQTQADFNRALIEEYRATGGRLSGPVDGGSIVLVTTAGERSGRPHTVPVAGAAVDDGAVVVVASANVAPEHPQWYRNLVAEPTVTVERGSEVWTAVARTATGEERSAVIAEVVDRLPFIPEHEARATGRQIPIVVLERADG